VREAAMARFLTGMPTRMEPAEGNPRLQAVIITADDQTGRATGIERIDWSHDEVAAACDAASTGDHDDDEAE
jgi:calcineurin-like phosphoesterase